MNRDGNGLAEYILGLDDQRRFHVSSWVGGAALRSEHDVVAINLSREVVSVLADVRQQLNRLELVAFLQLREILAQLRCIVGIRAHELVEGNLLIWLLISQLKVMIGAARTSQ